MRKIMFKYRIPQIVRWIYPNYTWKVKTQSKVVYFTFDDGPHPTITPWVLDLLKQYQAKATFFVVGENVTKFPETFQQVIKEGHAVGNHTYNHLKGWETEKDDYIQNFLLCQKLTQTSLFRPPYGRIKKQQAKEILKTHQIIMWDRLSRDYETHLNIEESIQSMKALPAMGAIFVFHDSDKAFNNLKVLLPELLSYFTSNGYRFELLK